MKGILAVCAFGCLLFWSACKQSSSPYSEPKLADTSEIDTTGQYTNGSFLKRLNEPALEELDYEVYRLIIFRTKSREHLLMRAQASNGDYQLIVKAFASFSREGVLIDSVFRQNEVSLQKEQWTELRDLIDSLEYWAMPSRVDRRGLDGSTWNLEGRRLQAPESDGKTNHKVQRWSPKPGEFRTLCEKMIEMAEAHGAKFFEFY